MSIDSFEIKDYLEGKASREQSIKMENWLKNPENEPETRKLLGEIWYRSQINIKGDKPDFERLLDRIHYRINSQAKNTILSKGKVASPGQKLFHLFSKAAAVLIIPLLLVTVYLYFNPHFDSLFSETAVMREIYTKPGTRIKMELPDGTMVWLNDGTVLKYPEQFKGKKRQVFVDGEAYFEVRSDAENPFVVENPMMNTTVTGTSFNINAYSSDKYFEVTLVEGKVQLEKNSWQFELAPGEQMQFDEAKTRFHRKTVNPGIYASWINGRLILEDEPLSIAVKKLGRRYNVDFIIEDEEVNNILLTATFQDEKIEQTLQNIAFALPVKFSVKEEIINHSPQKTIYLMKR